jgi:hypothetical protein
MFNSLFNIDAQEYNRILEIHKSATKRHYLLNEQTLKTVKSEPKRFILPNNTFVSGNYVNFNKEAVDEVIIQMNEYLKEFPKNQKIEVEIESSESKVPNRGVKLLTGELSKKRGQQMENYLKGKLPQNVNIILKDLGAQGPEWNPPPKATESQIKALASDERYTRWQYVSFNILTSAEKEQEFCDLGFYVIVDYKKEWCKPDVDESRCHKCNEAVFYMWANGIQLTTEKGDSSINLNNGTGKEKSGPSVEVKLFVSEEQKKNILSKNPEEISLTFGCALTKCHSDPVHITIINTNGDVLLEPTFITAGKRLKNTEQPVELLKLNKCGQVISIYDPEKKVQSPIVKNIPAFDLKYTEEGVDPKTLIQLYKFVENGVFNFPPDKMVEFRRYKNLQGTAWKDFVKDYNVTRKDLKNLENLLNTTPQ